MANPFTLTFGKKPTEYIVRYENTEEIVDAFTSQPPRCQTYLIRGVRGSGKTVLMTTIVQKISEEKDWICVDLNPTKDLVDEFANRLVDACEGVNEVLDRGVEVSAAGFGFGIGGQPGRDSVSRAEKVMRKLQKKGKKILIAIDEVENNQVMKQFASQFQIWIRRGYPIFLLMTGLYESIDAIQNSPQLTFLLRSPKITMGPLGIAQETRQYEKTLEVSEKIAMKLARETKGYAFAFQALGMLYWEYNDKETIEDIIRRLEELLDEYVYRKIWSDLTEIEKKIIGVIPDEGTIKTSNLCESAGVTPQVFSKYRERLINKGLINAAGHGYVEMALPRFASVCRYYVDFE